MARSIPAKIMFDLLRYDADRTFDRNLTAENLLEKLPELEIVKKDLPILVYTAYRLPTVLNKGSENPKLPREVKWLFELAGRVKGILPDPQRVDLELGETLSPLGLVLIDALHESLGDLRQWGRIRWQDPDAVMLEFEGAWIKRKHAKGTLFLDDAVKFALPNPLGLEGNIHFVRVLNVAYYLQKINGDRPILLPVSEYLAKQLGVTPTTLGTAVSKAIREHYLEVLDYRVSVLKGIARKFRFRFEHPDIQALELPE